MFRQSKTEAIVAIAQALALIERLAAAKERRKNAIFAQGLVLADEAARLPWTADRYRKVWAALRSVAIARVRHLAATEAAVASGQNNSFPRSRPT